MLHLRGVGTAHACPGLHSASFANVPAVLLFSLKNGLNMAMCAVKSFAKGRLCLSASISCALGPSISASVYAGLQSGRHLLCVWDKPDCQAKLRLSDLAFYNSLEMELEGSCMSNAMRTNYVKHLHTV